MAVPSLLRESAPLSVPRTDPEGSSEASGEGEGSWEVEEGSEAVESALSEGAIVARELSV